MDEPIRILFIEDLPTDTELAVREIRNNGLNFVWKRVDTKPDLVNALDTFFPDVVISDYSMPQFDGMRALQLAKEKYPIIPFIMLTGSMNEATAVECMKAGATDYVVKEHILRLPFAIREALNQRNIKSEKQHTELALAHEQQLMESLLDNIPDHIYFKDRDLRFLRVNKSMLNRFKAPNMDAVKGKSDLDFFSSEHALQAQKEEQRIIETGVPMLNIDEKETWSDGSVTWASSTKMPMRDSNGEIFGIFGISRDVTDRKVFEQQMRLQATAIQAAANAIVIADPKGSIQFVNSAFLLLTGYKETEVIGKNPGELLKSGMHSNAFYKDIWDTINAGKIWVGNFTNRRKDGSYFNDETTITPVLDERGKIEHFVAIKTDTTNRKNAESKLLSLNQRLTVLHEIDREILQQHNPKEIAASIFKHFRELIPCRRLAISLVDNDDKLHKLTVSDLIKSNKTEQIVDFLHTGKYFELLKSGKSVVLNNIYAIGNQEPIKFFFSEQDLSSLMQIPLIVKSRLIGVFYLGATEPNFFNAERRSIAEEISGLMAIALHQSFLNQKIEQQNQNLELKVRERTAQLEIANKAKSIFLANMSHEIRTPMNAVLGFAELLDGQLVDSMQKGYLKSIKNSGRSLLNIINDILDLSKIEAGQVIMNYAPVNFRKLIAETESILLLKLQEKGLHFKTTIPHDFPVCLKLDEFRIGQVLMNLISNAIKFTDEGEIEVSLSSTLDKRGNTDVVFSVRDTGIGISPANQESIFEAFRQQDEQDTRKYGGTGLGLSISLKLVQLMNGNILLESKQGIGSAFSVVLNEVEICSVNEIENTLAHGVDPNIDFEHAVVLVVDDVTENRTLVSEYLKPYNLTVLQAENGQQALEIVNSAKIDLIFMDLRMPVLDGYQATKLIHESEKTSKIPVIALTASVFSLSDVSAKLKGFSGFIRKPFQLVEMIGELMKYIPTVKRESNITDVAEVEEMKIVIDKKQHEALLTIFERELGTQRSFFQKRQSRAELVVFSKRICELGLRYGIPFITNYGEEIEKSIANFNVDRIKRLLMEFDLIVEKIRGIEPQ